ncbi:hypothetical protein ACHAW6_011449 [Cyclotella cf. meneghiniana]
MERVHCPSTTVTIATSTLTPLENSSSVILREMPALLDVRLLLIPTVAGELTEEERSKKNPTKVKRSAAYACPWMAKSIVLAGLCKCALVQLSYSIGVAKPLSLFIKTYGTEKAGLTAAAITDIVKLEFDCRPVTIRQSSEGMPVHQNLPMLFPRLLPLGDASSIKAACITNAKAPSDVSIFRPDHEICAIAVESHCWATSKFGNNAGSLDGVSMASIHSSLFIVMIGW